MVHFYSSLVVGTRDHRRHNLLGTQAHAYRVFSPSPGTLEPKLYLSQTLALQNRALQLDREKLRLEKINWRYCTLRLMRGTNLAAAVGRTATAGIYI